MEQRNVTMLPAEYQRAVRKTQQQGTVVEVSYRVNNYIALSRQLVTDKNISSEDVGRETIEGEAIIKKCNVYLPAGYDKNDTNTKYNVLYLLHGVGGDRYEWLSGGENSNGTYILCNIVDHLIENGDIEPLIIIFPEGRSTHNWTDCSFNSEGTNMLGFYYFDYELKYDLIPFIESEYHTYANVKDMTLKGIAYNRLHRAVAGLSMGGMQALNLVLGGYRCDSTVYTGTLPKWNNGLDTTVLAPGMLDLFAYVGAFSNAPTSSEGKVLGRSIATSENPLHLLYMTCGEADDIAYQTGYVKAIDGLSEAAGDNIWDYHTVLIKEGVHDFNVWNNGAYNFIRLSFGTSQPNLRSKHTSVLLKYKSKQ